MGMPEIKIKGAVSAGSSPSVVAPEWVAPDTIKGTPLANRLKADNPAQNPSLSPVVVSVEAEVAGAPVELGLCRSVVCQNVDAGVRAGYRPGLGSVPFSAYVQYRHALSPDLALVGRGAIGGEGMWGNVASAREMGSVAISGTPFQASLGIGAETAYQKYPLLAMVSLQRNSGADLGNGFNAKEGLTVFVTLAGGFRVFEEEKTSVHPANEPTDDTLPALGAMAARLKAFKIVVGDGASLSTYRSLLKQFAEGIASAAKTGKLAEADALAMMRDLAKLSLPLIEKMFVNPANAKASLEAALEALHYPILPLLKANPSDAATQKIADDILNQTLECATAEGKRFLPNVLEELATIGAGSSWLKSHKKELLEAAKKVTPNTERSKIEKSLKAALK